MAESEQQEEKSGLSITRIAIWSVGGLVAIIALIFIGGLVLAILDVERAGQLIQLLRDFLVIILTLEGIMILFAFAVLLIQIARSVNLVQTEVKPILDNTQDAVNTAKGTAEFVSKNAVQPVLRVSSFMAGLWAFVRELGGIRRAIRHARKGKRENGRQ
jgi:hypothetical protein